MYFIFEDSQFTFYSMYKYHTPSHFKNQAPIIELPAKFLSIFWNELITAQQSIYKKISRCKFNYYSILGILEIRQKTKLLLFTVCFLQIPWQQKIYLTG